jgi:predicted PurR-regulated permease PerM
MPCDIAIPIEHRKRGLDVRDLEGYVLGFIVVAVSLAFAWVLWPYFAALLWGVVATIVFAPVYRRLLTTLGQRRSLAAALTVLIVVLLVIVPLSLLGAALVQESAEVVARVQAGDINLDVKFDRLRGMLPTWASDLLAKFGITDLGDVRERLSAGLVRASQFLATQTLNIGQLTFGFLIGLGVMLYLLFFLLRDGDDVAARLRRAFPLPEGQQRALIGKFVIVIRATVKGSVLVAIAQGALGGVVFWLLGMQAPLLLAIVMTFVSLLPALGAALVWLPVAIYLLVTGSVWQGIVLIAFGVLVIGLVDNVLRPVLVGKDTKMPDWIVLLSTLGGIEALGINGLVMGPVIAALFMASWDIFSDWRMKRA